VSLAKDILRRKKMETALDYLLERLLTEPDRVSEVDAKTTEVRTSPTDVLTGSDHNDLGSPEKTPGEKLTRMKKSNQERGLQAMAKRGAEQATSRVIEGKKRHRRHGKRRSR
jgi:hypothetical protein